MKIYFREFKDGCYEIGVFEPNAYDGHFIMDVGNFAYSTFLAEWAFGLTVKQFLKRGGWKYIGNL